MHAADGNDPEVDGGAGDDTIEGGNGTNVLRDGTGTDLMLGGPNSDDITVTADGSTDYVNCGAGADSAHRTEGRDGVNRNCETVGTLTAGRYGLPTLRGGSRTVPQR